MLGAFAARFVRTQNVSLGDDGFGAAPETDGGTRREPAGSVVALSSTPRPEVIAESRTWIRGSAERGRIRTEAAPVSRDPPEVEHGQQQEGSAAPERGSGN